MTTGARGRRASQIFPKKCQLLHALKANLKSTVECCEVCPQMTEKDEKDSLEYELWEGKGFFCSLQRETEMNEPAIVR